MINEPKQSVEFRDFGGLVTDSNPHDRQAGIAIEQVNAVCTDLGELQSRGGTKLVTFSGSGAL